MMIDNELIEEFLGALQRYADKELVPRCEELDREERFDKSIVNALGRLGFFGIRFPEEYGGAGGSMSTACRALEIVSKANIGVASSLIVQLAVAGVLLDLATPEQKEEFLVPVVAGEALTGMAITEPDAGSDVRSMTTTAFQDGDDWILRGEKIYITNGDSCDFLIVAARLDTESHPIQWFIVRRDDPGFEVTSKLKKLGIKASETVILRFNDCRVSSSRIVGGDISRDGFVVAQEAFNQDRLLGAVTACGLALRALDEGREYLNAREQFGRTLASNQAIRYQFADLATDVQAGRALISHAAMLIDSGKPYAVEASMAKLYCGQMVRRVCTEILELHGGFGFMAESAISRMYRDAPISGIAGGTSNMQRELIGRSALKNGIDS